VVVADSWVPPMRRALELAAGASATGDVPIGAVVLDGDGLVVGEGANARERDGDPTSGSASGGSPVAPSW
jgi:tRNA(adenine34) deaminase